MLCKNINNACNCNSVTPYLLPPHWLKSQTEAVQPALSNAGDAENGTQYKIKNPCGVNKTYDGRHDYVETHGTPSR